jgi:hypothetical protein
MSSIYAFFRCDDSTRHGTAHCYDLSLNDAACLSDDFSATYNTTYCDGMSSHDEATDCNDEAIFCNEKTIL